MSFPVRHLMLGSCAILGALLSLTGCGSEDAGQTLTVQIVPANPTVVLMRSTVGAAATATTEGTPDVYTGQTTASAVIVYKGTKNIAYQWYYSASSSGSSAIAVVNNAAFLTNGVPSYTLSFSASTTHNVALDATSSGTITLTVYETNPGVFPPQSVTVSVPLLITSGSSG